MSLLLPAPLLDDVTVLIPARTLLLDDRLLDAHLSQFPFIEHAVPVLDVASPLEAFDYLSHIKQLNRYLQQDDLL